MREIKFRFWDGEQMMYEGWNNNFFVTKEIVFRYERIMQFTGLKDKKGKEIYEGDLITHKSRNGEKPHPIIFHKAAFCGDYGLIYPLNQEHFDKYCEIEVIGNIYETPELISDPGSS